MEQPLLFLIKLAWACRYRLPLLITIGFMALDIRMQLEIHVQMRRIRRDQIAPTRGRTQQHSQQQNEAQRNRNESEGSSSSWVTIEDEETEYSDVVEEMLTYSESEDDTGFHEAIQVHTLRNVQVEN